MNEATNVTGIEFTPLNDGRVILEFYGTSGETLNSQIFCAGLLDNIALTAHATHLAMAKGEDAAIAFLKSMTPQEASKCADIQTTN